jgi:hypothetical protein
VNTEFSYDTWRRCEYSIETELCDVITCGWTGISAVTSFAQPIPSTSSPPYHLQLHSTCEYEVSVLKVNNIHDQPEATVTILLIFESAQHVSGNRFPIFRSIRLWLQQCGVLSCCCSGLEVRGAAAWTACSV